MTMRGSGFEEEFEDWKRSAFGPYCMTKCDRTCCDMKNVSLQVNALELKSLFGKGVLNQDPWETGIKTVTANKRYSIETKKACPKFDPGTMMCLDYSRRPASCREYPFIVEKTALVIKSGCPLNKRDAEYRGLVAIASSYGKVIVKR